MPLPCKLQFNNQSGFTLIQIVIASGLLALVAALVFKAQVQTVQSKKSLKAGQNYQDINQIFTSEIAKILKNPPASGCFTPNDFSLDFDAGLTNSNMTFLTNIMSGASPAVVDAVSRSQNVSKSVSRCTQKIVQITNSSLKNDNKLHFCLKFKRVATAAKNSFLNAEHAFAEVAIHLKDFHTDKAISCDTYKNTPTSGAQIFYSLFWTTEIGGKLQFKRKNSVFHASSN